MKNLVDKIKYILSLYPDKESYLIKILQHIQKESGYIPEIGIELLSKKLKISESSIYGVITFYSQFRLIPFGKHIIKICHGTACHVNGAKSITDALMQELKINIGETTEDRNFSLEVVACLGCCSLSPVIMIDNKIYGKLTPGKILDIIRKYKGE